MKALSLLPLSAALLLGFHSSPIADPSIRTPIPNIIFILADDLGYGDVGSYNPESKIATPNLDALASQGMRFTDAHAPAAICTPSRYGIITGRYPWRGAWQGGVLKDNKSTSLIETNIPTLPALLKSTGYKTAFVGKWHLGSADRDTKGQRYSILHAGFAEDLALPLIGPRPSNKAEDYQAYDARVFAAAVSWLEKRVSDDPSQPFFLYICPRNPHDPWIPLDEWHGRSSIGSYGDVVMQLDAHVGDIAAALDHLGIAKNTLLVFTSDNGPERAKRDYSKPPFELPDDADDRIHITERRNRFGHDSSGGLRGSKYDAYEGGHRVPFIVRWPGVVPANTVNDHLLSLTDLFATFAAAARVTMPTSGAEDSINQRPVFLNPVSQPPRVDGIFSGISPHFASIRKGSWSLLERESSWWNKLIDGPDWELYELSKDMPQRHNLAPANTRMASKLRTRREAIELTGHRVHPQHFDFQEATHIWRQ